jgi:hypothetical protein
MQTHIHAQFTTFLLVLLLDLQAGQLAPGTVPLHEHTRI